MVEPFLDSIAVDGSVQSTEGFIGSGAQLTDIPQHATLNGFMPNPGGNVNSTDTIQSGMEKLEYKVNHIQWAASPTVTGTLTLTGNATIRGTAAATSITLGSDTGYNSRIYFQNNSKVRNAYSLETNGDLTKFISYDSSESTINTVFSIDNVANNGLFRIGKGFSVADDGASPNGNCFERVFVVTFPDATANQKVDLILGNADIGGYLEVSISSSWTNANAAGRITKAYSLGTSPGGSIWQQSTRYSEVIGTTGASFAISDVTWDSTNTRYRIQISHSASTGNYAVIRVRGMFGHNDYDNYLATMTVSSIYTTDTTVFPTPSISFINNVSLDASTGLTIASGAPSTTTSTLYNVSGTLYFNGSAVDTGINANALTIGNGLSGGSFNGSSATTIAVSAANNTANATYYPLFATSQGTAVSLGTQSTLTYNPSLGALTIPGTLTVAGTAATFGSNTSQAPYFTINGAAGYNRCLAFDTAMSNRWVMFADNAAEAGSNAGSNFELGAYTDAGAYIDAPLYIIRAANGGLYIPTNRTLTCGPVSATGTITATTFSGSGASLTNLPAANSLAPQP
jgi:hypothetical protein